jgi:hypothetical protein
LQAHTAQGPRPIRRASGAHPATIAKTYIDHIFVAIDDGCVIKEASKATADVFVHPGFG